MSNNLIWGDTVKEKDQMDLLHEQKRVDTVIKEVQDKWNKLNEESNNIGKTVVEIRKEFWEDVTVNLDEPDDIIETHTSMRQQAELLGERERSYGQIDKQLNKLKKLTYSPYFARIDFVEENEEKEKIYIGITSFMDKKDENFYIYDWRAPISSVYYDYSPGPASYNTPTGNIHGELVLKRQFIIRDGKIISLFDTGVTIGDEMLLEVLGNNANSMMKSIVATIQREQNAIIRNENAKILVVQGVAGSGKTSAALQRVAYLLYKHRQTLKSDNIMLFSPNPLFNSYVSTVLPELGEENMQQTTFQEYIEKRVGRNLNVEDPFMQLETLLSETNHNKMNTRLLSIQYKSRTNFKDKLDIEIHKLLQSGMIFKDIVFRGKVLLSKEELSRKFYELETNINVPNRLQLIKEWAQKEMRKHAKTERKQKWVEDEMELLEKEDYLEAYKSVKKKEKKEDEFGYFYKEETLLRKWIVNKSLKPIYRAIKKLRFIDYINMYKAIFSTEKPNILKSEEWDLIQKMTIANLDNKMLWNEDATAFAYFKDKVEGERSSKRIRQVFIDEAQDYSDFQIEYIKELFPYSKMTLLGDINQSIYAHNNNDFMEVTAKEGIERIILTKSYRSTQEIVEFTKYLATSGTDIEPFNRHGEKPTIIEVSNEELMERNIVRIIEEWRKKGNQTIAVIGKTQKESNAIYQSLKKSIDVHLIEKGTISYEKGISVIPAYLAKGIEFDAVILFNISSYKTEIERELFYTACTRAMHELCLFTVKGQENLFLNMIDRNSYEYLSEG